MTTPRSKADDSVVSQYKRLASRYDNRWPLYIEATTRETLARLAVKPNDRILDVGCGTGVLLQRLNETCPQTRLVGIDPVPEMLAVAANRLHQTIELREASAEQLPFANGSFDAVISCSVFHYLREPAAALKETKRVLRGGGQLVLTDWSGDYFSMRLCDVYLRLFNPIHLKVYRAKELHQSLEDAGFSETQIEKYKINWLWGMMTATSRTT